MADQNIIELTAEIVSAHVSNNQVATSDLPALIQSVFGALDRTTRPVEPAPVVREPAVPIRSSIKPDHLVCLEDGAKVKMLKRYLRTRFDLSPEEYRSKWGLPRDYPMVAPNYAEKRRALANAIGLGRKKIVESAAAVVEEVKHGVETVASAVGLAEAKPAPVKRGPRAAKAPADAPKPATPKAKAPAKAAATKIVAAKTTAAKTKTADPAKAPPRAAKTPAKPKA